MMAVNRGFLALLIGVLAGSSLVESPAAAAESASNVSASIDCRDARLVAGMQLTGEERPGNAGELRSVDRIVLTTTSRTVGFLYTARDGSTYVADRSSRMLASGDLVVMNALVQYMGGFLENAFDPRDDGYVYYPVRWTAQGAKDLGVQLSRCPS
jgi:hypothetical protein